MEAASGLNDGLDPPHHMNHPEHAARLDLEAIDCVRVTTLTSPKENIQSYCPKTGDGLLGDVECSLIMPGDEMKGAGKAVTPFLNALIWSNVGSLGELICELIERETPSGPNVWS